MAGVGGDPRGNKRKRESGAGGDKRKRKRKKKNEHLLVAAKRAREAREEKRKKRESGLNSDTNPEDSSEDGVENACQFRPRCRGPSEKKTQVSPKKMSDIFDTNSMLLSTFSWEPGL